MQSRLIPLLQSFSLEEMQEVEHYLSFFPSNKNQKLRLLFEGLKAYYPGFELIEEDWLKVFQQMWPGRAMDIPEFRNKLSGLKSLLYSYLAWKELQEKREEEQIFTLSQLRKRELHPLFESESKKLLKQLNKEQRLDDESYFLRYRIADESNYIFGQRQLRQHDSNLKDKVDALDAYYLTVRLRESCEMLNRQLVLNSSVEDEWLEPMLESLKSKPQYLEKWPGIAIYVQIYSCYQQPDDPQAYEKLKELLFSKAPLFPQEEARGMYRHAQNYCIRHANRGKQEYLQELLILFKKQLVRQINFQRGMLAHTDFKNIVTVSLRLKEYEWAASFLEEYRSKVHPKYRDNVYHFCKANWFHSQGKAREAIRLLQSVEFTDIFYQISSRMLLIQLYYHMKDWEALFYALDAFDRFLKRTTSLEKSRKDGHLGFIKSVRKLAKLYERKMSFSQVEFQKRKADLKIKLQQEKSLTNARWIMEQMEF